MDLRFFFTKLDFRRVPLYLPSLAYAYKKNILRYVMGIKGLITLPEGVFLYKLANSLPTHSIIVELGCYRGLSTVFLLSGIKNKKGFLYSIDPFEDNVDQQIKLVNRYDNAYYKKVELRGINKKCTLDQVRRKIKNKGFKNFKLIQGYSFNVVKDWKEKIDLLWIDASHNYKDVKRDFKQWSPFLKKGGFIAFHDANKRDNSKYWKWGWEGPTRVVKKYLNSPKWIKIARMESIISAKKNF
jgi:predicted O-methyltransferase YrrM